MTPLKLKDLRDVYVQEIAKLEAKDIASAVKTEIEDARAKQEEQFATYREQRIVELEEERKADILRMQHYVELLDKLISEVTDFEADVPADSTVDEDVATDNSDAVTDEAPATSDADTDEPQAQDKVEAEVEKPHSVVDNILSLLKIKRS